MELLDERWTVLVVRELLLGSSHFNDLRRGVPKMSPALLSKRLQTLTRAGVVQRSEDNGRTTYALTECGKELVTVVEAVGAWSVRWFGELVDKDLDPQHPDVGHPSHHPVDQWPRQRTVVEFRLSGVVAKASRWWLIVARGEPDVCDFDPGYDIAATITTDVRTLAHIWCGDVSWQRSMMDGSVTIDAQTDVRRAIPTWVGQSSLAGVPRLA